MAASAYPQPYGDYVLLERLGVGGMSQVDLARKAVEDAEYVRFCVIKRIKADRSEDEAFVRMFKDEARITAELNHANIAHVYDFGRHGDEYYLALEYVPGIDLRQLVTGLRHKGERLPLAIGLKILADVLDGLGYAHDMVDAFGRPMNVVHRDVNPRNVMISVRGEVKLIDFGVAKATNRLERTRTDHVKGKFAYMAPEQITADEVDRRADLFAVGLCLHEIVTGYGPFNGMSQVQIMHRLMSGRMPDLPAPPELRDPGPLLDLHRRALAIDKEARFQSAAEFKAALVEVTRPLGGLARQADVAALVAMVEPELADRLREKAETYSGVMLPSQVATVPMPTLPRLLDGTLERSVAGAPEDSLSGSRTATRTQIVAGGAAVGAGLALLLVFGIAIGAGVLAYSIGWEPLQRAPQQVGPTVTDVLGPGPEPEPVPAAEAEPVAPPVEHDTGAPRAVGPVTEPAPRVPTPVPTTDPGPPAPTVTVAPSQPVPVAPEPAMTVVTVPAPAPTPTPIVLTAPQPAPAPVPIVLLPDPEPPPPVVTGKLQVSASVKGLRIYIDGKDTGYVTPAEFEWPEGRYEIRAGEFTQQIDLRGGLSKTVLLR